MHISHRSAAAAVAATVCLMLSATAAAQPPNKCIAGKDKCASRRMQGLLRCHRTAENTGMAVDPACTQRVDDKYSGGANPSRGCFAKLEERNDGPCATFGDSGMIGTMVDDFVDDVVTDLDPGYPTPITNSCSAAKKQCVRKLAAARLKCHEKAVKNGASIADPVCLQKATDKFDGGPDPTNGCFAKLESRGGCLTTGDTTTLGGTTALFVLVLTCQVGDWTSGCDPTPTPPPSRTPTPTATPTCVAAPSCGNAFTECGEDCDPPGIQCPNAAPGILCSASCQCPCPGSIELAATSTNGVLDLGWTGLMHDSTVVSDGTVTVDVTSCAGSTRPCGVCSFIGPIANAGAADYTAMTGTQINNHRCSGDTRTTCVTNADCAVAGGTCVYYLGAPVPLTIGAFTSVCIVNRYASTFTGTANIESGARASSGQLVTSLYNGVSNLVPCPRCVGDAIANDGVRGGTCDAGLDNGQPCDINGSSPNPHLGSTSFDCRPPANSLLPPPLTVGFTQTTGTRSMTLGAASPGCRATGFTGDKCFCDTCASLAQEPCSSNADCVGGRICGGLRCQTGANAGGVCTVAGANSQCPGGFCGRPGLATAPNPCADGTCTPTTGNEGECAAGPLEFFCAPNATMVPCASQSDCDVVGYRSCVGGANANAVCTVASECPGGACDVDTCTLLKYRSCYTDNGVIGATVSATGAPDVPVNDASDPTLASLFCIGPIAQSSTNSVWGIPGLGRLQVTGHSQGRP